jgi:hypothetical protein
MKFIKPNTTLRQYDTVKVTNISPKRMAQCLACVDSIRSYHFWIAEIENVMCNDTANIYMFRSGAKLNWSQYSGAFTIYGYSDGGDDIRAAIAELKCLDSLVKAKADFQKMVEFQHTYTVQNGAKMYPTLDVTFSRNTQYPQKQSA